MANLLPAAFIMPTLSHRKRLLHKLEDVTLWLVLEEGEDDEEVKEVMDGYTLIEDSRYSIDRVQIRRPEVFFVSLP